MRASEVLQALEPFRTMGPAQEDARMRCVVLRMPSAQVERIRQLVASADREAQREARGEEEDGDE